MSARKFWSIFSVALIAICVAALCVTTVAVGAGLYLSPRRVTMRTSWSTQAQSQSDGVLRLYARDPVTLDPALAGDANSTEYIDKIFNGLVVMDKDLNIVPELAEKWEISPDGTQYTFHLRRNIAFQDGTPITAKDFKYTIERALDPKTGSRVASTYMEDIVGAMDKLSGKATEVKGVEVLDDNTLRITIDSPKQYFLPKLTYHTFFVVDRRNVEQGGQEWWRTPNGSGPFALKSMDKDKIVLTSNKRYVGGAPPIGEVDFTLRGGSPMTMYDQGELDAVQVPSSYIDQVLDKTNPLHNELTTSPSLDVWYLAFDTKQKPFDDPKVRQAFAYATNKEGIARVLLQKTVIPANGVLPPGLPGFDKSLAGIPYDPERARALLAESSYKGSEKLPPILFATSGEGSTDPLAAALTEMWSKELGVDIELQQVSWDRFQQDLYNNKYQMFMLGWVGDYPDPQDFLDVQFYSQSEQNHSRYANPEVDKLLLAARQEQDQQKRWDLYHQAEQIIVNEVPWIPIYHGINYVLTKPYVKSLSVTPQGEWYLNDAHFVK